MCWGIGRVCAVRSMHIPCGDYRQLDDDHGGYLRIIAGSGIELGHGALWLTVTHSSSQDRAVSPAEVVILHAGVQQQASPFSAILTAAASRRSE